MSHPILYSFRRCPYAMRARLALYACQMTVEIREILLRDKPEAMLCLSPKGTVPVLKLSNSHILEESLDVMYWAVANGTARKGFEKITFLNDDIHSLVMKIDGAFKENLDRYKYASRYPGADPVRHREACMFFLAELDNRLQTQIFLFSQSPGFADLAIAPFIRQFANTDREWFFATAFTHLHRWLNRFCDSDIFAKVMEKQPVWRPGAEPVFFPGETGTEKSNPPV